MKPYPSARCLLYIAFMIYCTRAKRFAGVAMTSMLLSPQNGAAQGLVITVTPAPSRRPSIVSKRSSPWTALSQVRPIALA